MRQLEFATDEMARIVEIGFRALLEQLEEPKDASVLRRFNKAYPELQVEEIAAVLAASGQQPGAEPNEVSRAIAKNELKLREE